MRQNRRNPIKKMYNAQRCHMKMSDHWGVSAKSLIFLKMFYVIMTYKTLL